MILKLPMKINGMKNMQQFSIYSEKGEKIITETEQLLETRLIESTGMKIQEIFRQTAVW